MDLNEDINRIKILMIEDKSIPNMVKTLGLYDAIRYFGGYENLKSMIGDNDIKNVISNSVISRKDKVELIKQLVKEINESLGNQPDDGFWCSDLGKDPLEISSHFVYDDEITLIELGFFSLDEVFMYYYGGENNSREMGYTQENYDYLPDSVLDSIIEYLL
jgi:hypothetical protein